MTESQEKQIKRIETARALLCDTAAKVILAGEALRGIAVAIRDANQELREFEKVVAEALPQVRAAGHVGLSASMLAKMNNITREHAARAKCYATDAMVSMAEAVHATRTPAGDDASPIVSQYDKAAQRLAKAVTDDMTDEQVQAIVEAELEKCRAKA